MKKERREHSRRSSLIRRTFGGTFRDSCFDRYALGARVLFSRKRKEPSARMTHAATMMSRALCSPFSWATKPSMGGKNSRPL